MEKIKVIIMGLGPLGVKTVKFASRRNLEITGAVDINPSVKGKNLGKHCGIEGLSIPISSSVKEALARAKADVVILTTVSDVKRIVSQIKEIAECGLHVVSTCEELSYPWDAHSEGANEIDGTAKKCGVAVIGTGVNPGFLMDFLPTALTAVCQNVEKIKVSRIQNAQFRRVPFQKKIGAGLTLDEFEAKKNDGSLRHVGLTESIQMIASRMGWKLDRTEDIIEAVIAEKDIVTDAITIKAGNAAGVFQTGRGWSNGKELISLIFRAAVGEPETYDLVEITGEPDIRSKIEGGVNGDIATCAIIINAVKQIIRVSPGLKTMVDIPAVSFFN
ncbi:MAG: hypothetical protein A2017_18565 [Lentisphaerae bacterium GWF2_44_16]|nr:MAG: hypothetical protein A2017_18565 [Lentisphaerae bacterium GWF2_44_16]